MKDRLLQLLSKLNYSATRLADELNVQRSGISHILSGRNQPSYDFMVKILNRFPEIDAEWLILGKGNMLKNPKENKDDRKAEITVTKPPEVTTIPFPDKPKSTISDVTNVNNVSRVILLNANGTFDVYDKTSKD